MIKYIILFIFITSSMIVTLSFAKAAGKKTPHLTEQALEEVASDRDKKIKLDNKEEDSII